jgi:quercetin dioxygenase-like cupin family protein
MKSKITPVKLSRKEARLLPGLRLWEYPQGRRPPFSVFLVTLAPHQDLAAIYHAKTHEFFLMLEGVATGRVGGRRVRFRKGDFAVLPPGTLHDLHSGKSAVKALAVFSPPVDMREPDVVSPGRKGD